MVIFVVIKSTVPTVCGKITFIPSEVHLGVALWEKKHIPDGPNVLILGLSPVIIARESRYCKHRISIILTVSLFALRVW